MDTTHPSTPSWDVVLGAVEDDVRRTEALLRLAVATPEEFAALSAPDPTAAVLPDLDTMPAIDSELLARVHTLRERIAEVRRELELALDSTPDPFTTGPIRIAAGVGERSQYLDTTV